MSRAPIDGRLKDLFDALAGVITYPGSDSAEVLDRAIRLASGQKKVEAELQVFRDETAKLSITEFEELFTRTFDLNPVAALDIGWHIWGDAYERGRFLAEVREWLMEEGVAENGELPDHLTHVLPLLARLDERRSIELAHYVRTSLEKLRKPFAETDNPYSHVLAAIAGLIDAVFPAADEVPATAGAAPIGAGYQPYEVNR